MIRISKVEIMWKSTRCRSCPVLAYIGVEAMAGTDSVTRGCFKICRGGSVNVVGPSMVLVFVLGIVELWLLLRFDSESSSYISFSSARTCFPLLNFLSFSNSGLQCSTKCFRSASLNPNSRRLFSAAISAILFVT